jgi:molybdopterin-synthase adenylyltransferase
MPSPSFSMDFDLLRETLGRIFTVEENPFLIKFRADDHDVVVFHDGRAMVFGTSDPKAALSLYGKFVGG